MNLQERANDLKDKITAPAKFQLDKINLANKLLAEQRETNKLLRAILSIMKSNQKIMQETY